MVSISLFLFINYTPPLALWLHTMVTCHFSGSVSWIRHGQLVILPSALPHLAPVLGWLGQLGLTGKLSPFCLSQPGSWTFTWWMWLRFSKRTSPIVQVPVKSLLTSC